MFEPQKFTSKPADKAAATPAEPAAAPSARRLSAPAIGAGVAIGSAAIAAALLYWNRSKPAPQTRKAGDATD